MEPYEPTQAVVQPPGEADYTYPTYPYPNEAVPPPKQAEPVQYARPVDPVQHVQMVDPAQAHPGAPLQYVQPVAPLAVTRNFWTGRIVYLVLSILETLLVIRIFLMLLAANPNAGFSMLIYSLTTPFVLPFQGVFPEPQTHGSVFDLAALLAIIIYPIVAWIILRIVQMTRRPAGTLQ